MAVTLHPTFNVQGTLHGSIRALTNCGDDDLDGCPEGEDEVEFDDDDVEEEDFDEDFEDEDWDDLEDEDWDEDDEDFEDEDFEEAHYDNAPAYVPERGFVAGEYLG